jgi:DivIVA domain-containing protein
VTDTVVGAVSDTAVSDAAGKAVPARVAEQAPPEPYVPGSGDKLPAELRLVLGGYAGIACGLFVGALACAAAAVFLLSYVDDLDAYDDMYGLLVGLASLAPYVAIPCIWALWRAFKALQACILFSRLLRRPSDPRTATVMASKRGGRAVILDIPRDGTRRGYQPLSEVRLALWLKAGTLVPGERVKIYAQHRPAHMGPGGSEESPLLVRSPRRGRAFLGTVTSQSALQPRLLDEKVSDDVTLVDWAAWAASTTFSSTGLRFGYETREVDAFRSAVRDTFLGASEPAVRSDDVRGKQFSTHRPGYDKKQVDAFLDSIAAGLRLAAMESTDWAAGPLVRGALLVAWAEWADSTTFSKHHWRRRGYEPIEVDAFLDAIRDTFLGVGQPPVRAGNVRGKQFSTHRPGYDKTQVDAFLEAAGIRLAAMESTDKPQGPPASGAILADWAEWADSTRFSTTALLQGYARAEVDAFREELRDTFLGVRQPPVVSGHVRGKQFSTHWFGYDTQQVYAFIEKAAWRLSAMESTDKPQGPLVSWILAEWAEWAEWADSTRFETTRRLGEAYDAGEVDAIRKEIRDTFLGVRQPPLTSHAVHGKQFTPTRMRGYDVQQVDAFLDQAELRLAAMLPTDIGAT